MVNSTQDVLFRYNGFFRYKGYLYRTFGCAASPEASGVSDDDVTGEPEAAAARHTDTSDCVRCGSSSSAHIPRKSSCPANGEVCRSCSRVEHFKRCCKSKPASSASVVSGSVTAAAAQISWHPRLVVAVSQAQGGGPSPISVSTVADTCVMVCGWACSTP